MPLDPGVVLPETWLNPQEAKGLAGFKEATPRWSARRAAATCKGLRSLTSSPDLVVEKVLRRRYQFLLGLREQDIEVLHEQLERGASVAAPKQVAQYPMPGASENTAGDPRDQKAAWKAPPMDPAAFVLAVRDVHSKRRADPDGWPWTTDKILSEFWFLDDARDQHRVTNELLHSETGACLLQLWRQLTSQGRPRIETWYGRRIALGWGGE